MKKINGKYYGLSKEMSNIAGFTDLDIFNCLDTGVQYRYFEGKWYKQPTTWVDADDMEAGSSGGSSSGDSGVDDFIVSFLVEKPEYPDSEGTATSDKTYAEILAAIESGMNVRGYATFSDGGSLGTPTDTTYAVNLDNFEDADEQDKRGIKFTTSAIITNEATYAMCIYLYNDNTNLAVVEYMFPGEGGGGGADVMVVTFTGAVELQDPNDTPEIEWSCDTSFADIYEAYSQNKLVIARMVATAQEFYPLIAINGYIEGTLDYCTGGAVDFEMTQRWSEGVAVIKVSIEYNGDIYPSFNMEPTGKYLVAFEQTSVDDNDDGGTIKGPATKSGNTKSGDEPEYVWDLSPMVEAEIGWQDLYGLMQQGKVDVILRFSNGVERIAYMANGPTEIIGEHIFRTLPEIANNGVMVLRELYVWPGTESCEFHEYTIDLNNIITETVEDGSGGGDDGNDEVMV